MKGQPCSALRMKLVDFSVARYKSLARLSMNDIGNLAVIIGPNGSGKSNIMEAIHLFFTEFNLSHNTTAIDQHHFYRLDQRAPIQFDVVVKLEDPELKTILGDFLIAHAHPLNTITISAKLGGGGDWLVSRISLGLVPLIDNGEDVTQQSFLKGLSFEVDLGTLVRLDPFARSVSLPKATYNLLKLKLTEAFAYPSTYIANMESRVVYSVADDLQPFFNNEPVQVNTTRDQWLAEEGLVLSDQILSLATISVPTVSEIKNRVANLLRTALVTIPPLKPHGISYQRDMSVTSSLEYELTKLI